MISLIVGGWRMCDFDSATALSMLAVGMAQVVIGVIRDASPLVVALISFLISACGEGTLHLESVDLFAFSWYDKTGEIAGLLFLILGVVSGAESECRLVSVILCNLELL
jgi:hypothetical protein